MSLPMTDGGAKDLALQEARSVLERYRSQNLILHYEGPHDEDGVAIFTAYVASHEEAERRYADLAIELVRLSRKHGVTMLLDVEVERTCVNGTCSSSLTRRE
ncbi:hypothetical protein P23p19 [Thermus phage P23-45]|uniref:Uncharacterized protein n=1 Tax=Thermus virus P23-45 TaxID=2914006 RepID=A7XX40_BP234|nr:hypothetical protein P23p19 [Thermus phage P23-45]ABU96852.1 hypothetical protein P23p19 [Thermus phage P23-45]